MDRWRQAHLARPLIRRSEPSHAPHTLKGARPLRCRGRILFGASEIRIDLCMRELHGPQSWPRIRAQSEKDSYILQTSNPQIPILNSFFFFARMSCSEQSAFHGQASDRAWFFSELLFQSVAAKKRKKEKEKKEEEKDRVVS